MRPPTSRTQPPLPPAPTRPEDPRPITTQATVPTRRPPDAARWSGELRPVDRDRRSRLGEQLGDHGTEFGGVPPGALVDLRSVGPALGDTDDATLDLEHLAGDILGLDAAE